MRTFMRVPAVAGQGLFRPVSLCIQRLHRPACVRCSLGLLQRGHNRTTKVVRLGSLTLSWCGRCLRRGRLGLDHRSRCRFFGSRLLHRRDKRRLFIHRVKFRCRGWFRFQIEGWSGFRCSRRCIPYLGFRHNPGHQHHRRPHLGGGRNHFCGCAAGNTGSGSAATPSSSQTGSRCQSTVQTRVLAVA